MHIITGDFFFFYNKFQYYGGNLHNSRFCRQVVSVSNLASKHRAL